MITIDAGVDESRFYGVDDVEAPEVVLTWSGGEVPVPCEPEPGGVIVRFPGETTKAWPAATGTATLTGLVDGERVVVGSDQVEVVHATLDAVALRQAIVDAVALEEAYAASTPTAEQAIAHTKTMASHLAWIGRFILDHT